MPQTFEKSTYVIRSYEQLTDTIHKSFLWVELFDTINVKLHGDEVSDPGLDEAEPLDLVLGLGRRDDDPKVL